MKRILMLFLALTCMFCIPGCSDNTPSVSRSSGGTDISYESDDNSQITSDQNNPSEVNSSSVISSEENSSSEQTENGTKSLVVFFSRTGENYDVGVIEKGNTHIIADMIAEEMKADTFFFDSLSKRQFFWHLL